MASYLGRKHEVTVGRFIVACALANGILFHRPLIAFALSHLALNSFTSVATAMTVLLLAVLVSVLLLGAISLISTRALKPICMMAAMLSAISLYFIDTYGVVLDKSMMDNVLNTNPTEVRDLLHPKLIIYLATYGIIPCWLLSRVRVVKTSWRRRLALPAATLVLVLGWMYAVSSTWLWFDQNSRTLGGLTLPWAYVIGMIRAGQDHLAPYRQEQLPPAHFLTQDKTIVILVIGESARAANFSLYGYPRPTNPWTSADGILAFAGVRACATYTTAALSCILSARDAGWALSTHTEPLPSYLHRHGVDVIWRTNNWGEPPITVNTYQRAEDIPGACQGDSCRYDEALLHGLGARIRSSTATRIFVVLHLHGSHGPAYAREFPPSFATFVPICLTVELHACAPQALINAYDNSIRYTDHVLDQTIQMLKSFSSTATLLIYLSDHGESLGEYGLYLHGAPFAVAPDEQKNVPFLIWTSDEFRQRHGVRNSLPAIRWNLTQFNVFHSVMGAFDMRSDAYAPALDIFAN
ncbi:MAG: phosphoethanolamine--lipid A transferase EptA [Steroidobacteraceae bacterium]